MKNFIINNLMEKIKKTGKYDKTKLEEIKYGLEGIYLTFSKLIIISLATIYLNIFKEFLIFTLFYNVIRATSFGLHATKSWICLISSLIIFIGAPLICLNITIPIYLKSIIGILLIFAFYKNAPADTIKRPIISQKRRNTYKFLSVIIVIIFSIASIIVTNKFISNCLLINLIVQSFLISPYVYKLFNLSYDNYKVYLESNPV